MKHLCSLLLSRPSLQLRPLWLGTEKMHHNFTRGLSKLRQSEKLQVKDRRVPPPFHAQKLTQTLPSSIFVHSAYTQRHKHLLAFLIMPPEAATSPLLMIGLALVKKGAL